MGRYVILLVAPVLIGFCIAAVVVAFTELRRHRREIGGVALDVDVKDFELPPLEPPRRDQSTSRVA